VEMARTTFRLAAAFPDDGNRLAYRIRPRAADPGLDPAGSFETFLNKIDLSRYLLYARFLDFSDFTKCRYRSHIMYCILSHYYYGPLKLTSPFDREPCQLFHDDCFLRCFSMLHAKSLRINDVHGGQKRGHRV